VGRRERMRVSASGHWHLGHTPSVSGCFHMGRYASGAHTSGLPRSSCSYQLDRHKSCPTSDCRLFGRQRRPLRAFHPQYRHHLGGRQGSMFPPSLLAIVTCTDGHSCARGCLGCRCSPTFGIEAAVRLTDAPSKTASMQLRRSDGEPAHKRWKQDRRSAWIHGKLSTGQVLHIDDAARDELRTAKATHLPGHRLQLKVVRIARPGTVSSRLSSSRQS